MITLTPIRLHLKRFCKRLEYCIYFEIDIDMINIYTLRKKSLGF